ncbi:hypothetical protein DAPPUDRAFT_311619 [Daphnia pulex]|uniref:Gustatory receptor n=1 Tax=Daphnia pulex TaxID=6669 RepID=E9FXE9_DAPPU|nr:hypothetical protein DAPPUDRAFT_311619 [Daphnia pulex]|eukprot:EFX88066.1 hypothetical protein DAPPUDRAFT_311619 [Daphnia pulex]
MAIRVSWFSEEIPIIQQPATNWWAWSIRPLIIWLRIIGVDLPDTSTPSTQRNRWHISVYRAFCFLLHASCQINILRYLFNTGLQVFLYQTDDLGFGTTTANWNWIIDFTNYTIHGVGIHLVLLTVIRFQWIDTMEIFQRLNAIFTEENYIGIRKISYWGVIYVIVLISTLLAASADYALPSGTSLSHSVFIKMTAVLSITYPLTAIVIFAIHCYASSLAFEGIRKEIKRYEIELINGRNHDVSLLLSVFKQKHIIACDTVDSINHTFGWMLLFSMTFFFVVVINASYAVFGLPDHTTVADISFLAFALVHLPLICFAADHISNKAENMIKELMRLKFADEPLKGYELEVEFLIVDMVETIPQISAKDYFRVNKRLFPQVIGTTLTYFFILHQFKASEKKLDPEDDESY